MGLRDPFYLEARSRGFLGFSLARIQQDQSCRMMYLARRLYLTFTATSCWVAEVTGEYIPFDPLPAYLLPSRPTKLT